MKGNIVKREVEFESPEEMREALKIVFNNHIEFMVNKAIVEKELEFDIILRFGVTLRYDPATKKGEKASQDFLKFLKKSGGKLNS